jgi:antitoxin HicB
MADREYTIILHPDEQEGGYTVTVPALPGCVTEGNTQQEAIDMAREAIAGYLEALAKRGEPAPEEHQHPELVTVRVPAAA